MAKKPTPSFPEVWHLCSQIKMCEPLEGDTFPNHRWVLFGRQDNKGKVLDSVQVLMTTDEIFFEVGHIVRLGVVAVKG